MKRFSRVIEIIANIGGYISGWLVFLMMLLTVFEVFMRYVVHRPLLIADEFSAYMLVAVAFIGMAYTWKIGGHVRITALVDRIPTRTASWLRLAMLFWALVFSAIMVRVSISYMVYSFKIHMTSPTWLRVPQQGPQMTLPIGFTLLCLWLIVEIARAIVALRSVPDTREGQS